MTMESKIQEPPPLALLYKYLFSYIEQNIHCVKPYIERKVLKKDKIKINSRLDKWHSSLNTVQKYCVNIIYYHTFSSVFHDENNILVCCFFRTNMLYYSSGILIFLHHRLITAHYK